MLDPQAHAFLKFLADNNALEIHTLGAELGRKGYRERRGLTQPAPVAVGEVVDHAVPLADGTGTMLVRAYRPSVAAGQNGQVEIGAALPALLYMHGGGWTIGDVDTHDVLCRSLCQQAGVVVLSVDYRLAPEHPFPAAFHDTLSAFRWAVEQAKMLGIDPARMAVGGDSAGGNLAAAAALALRSEAVAPAYQLLIYPATDMNMRHPSHTSNGQGYLLTRPVMDWFSKNYLPNIADRNDWRASPLLAADLAHLPPALVLTAGFDPLCDEGLAYADALSTAGVATEYVCFERQIHGFITMGRVLREAAAAIDVCAGALRRNLK